MKRAGAALAVCAAAVGLSIPAAAGAAQDLPAGCVKEKGTIVCTTTEGPGKNQGGVGETTTTTTQGNTDNFSPEPQGTGQNSTCRPPSSEAICGG